MSLNLPQHLFVYGSLKFGCVNHSLLKRSDYVCKAITADRYTVVARAYPLAQLDPDGKAIFGEIYKIKYAHVLEDIDRLEHNGFFYTRHIRKLYRYTASKESILAWVYEIPDLDVYAKMPECPVSKHLDVYEWTP